MEEMERIARQESLKSWVQQQMFCPICRSILDMRKAVEVSIQSPTGAEESSRVVCANCWDKPDEGLEMFKRKTEERGFSLVHYDGRKLFDEPDTRKPQQVHDLEFELPGGIDPDDVPDMETLMGWALDGVAEATDGCTVEPDGTCEHGCKSWLRELGLV